MTQNLQPREMSEAYNNIGKLGKLSYAQAAAMTADPMIEPPSVESPLWEAAEILGNFFVLTEHHVAILYPVKIEDGKKKSMRITNERNWVHLLCTKSLKTFSFKKYKHQGKMLWSDSRDLDKKSNPNHTIRKDREHVVSEMARMCFGRDLVAAGNWLYQHGI